MRKYAPLQHFTISVKYIDNQLTSKAGSGDMLIRTKETLATGHFMSVINILMQLRKVCNHPDLFDPRPTVSPFSMDGIVYNTASPVLHALHTDPMKVTVCTVYPAGSCRNTFFVVTLIFATDFLLSVVVPGCTHPQSDPLSMLTAVIGIYNLTCSLNIICTVHCQHISM